MSNPTSTLTCADVGCPGLNGAGQIITKGMAGRGGGILIGFFYLQIKKKEKVTPRPPPPGVPFRFPERNFDRPGSIAGPIPEPRIYIEPHEYENTNLVDVLISIKWPFMEKYRRLQFTMDRGWANVIVNRIKQINTFNEQFKVKIDTFNTDFKVKLGEFKENFITKFKPKK